MQKEGFTYGKVISHCILQEDDQEKGCAYHETPSRQLGLEK
jgi:hypothetical protein